MPVPENKLKAALARGDMQIGLWLNLGDAGATEIAAAVGFDWCLIDAEHGPYDPVAIQAQLRALAPFDASAVVRVPIGEEWVIKQVLDLGVQSLLVPLIDTAEDAARMVRAVRYAPAGVRGMGASVARASGYGRMADYVQTADAQICLMVQAETRRALENLDAIAATEGVDGVFIGPADLSADMGYPGNPDAPEVQAAIADAIGRIRAAGKAAGIIYHDPGAFVRLRDLGVNFLGIGSEASLLRAALDMALDEARESLG